MKAAAKERHKEAHQSIDGFQKFIGEWMQLWHARTQSTLDIHKNILTEDKYVGSPMMRDLVAEAIGWYGALLYPLRHWGSGGGK